MEITGIGNDIVEIDRIKKAIVKNSRFKDRVYTSNEIDYLEKKSDPYPGYAGRFAAKEAVSKAMGTGVRGFNLCDIEVVNNSLGKPEVKFYGALEEKYKDFKVMLTISHSREYATAMAILFKCF
ncbi:holo-ACP synthase [Ilyobacter polytropus]|uniref:Holo-[acyl-carrier-protein] synthase n=1 Tax=Ilyobacter polytropus (strain ATCC 51220 / DSM 2926 / LMG 16218 / CuHBu1) TaxID=572544 RepID=E3HAY5_ILYPC|nr:holo-ACP synthase [Ilyobacter polytropus]ADO82134.1 holo-acyl-carrier-protein synthase [Ilyobacter polytropus DSM 2926]